MKHTKTKIIFACLLLLSIFSFRLNAALSGVYTINSAVITGGTNYQTFTAFATDINAQGISGPVTVNVVLGSGPYTQQVEFLAIVGTSATNTITINGNSTTLTFGGGTTANPHTMRLSGTDYMYINNLNLVGTNGTNAMVLHLWNGADHNRFDNCTFTAPLNGTGTRHYPVCMSGSSNGPTTAGNSGSDNIWTGCTMSGGLRAVNFYGMTSSPYNTGNQVINCTLADFYQYGAFVYYCQNTTYSGNIIQRLNRTNSTTCYGIYLSTQAYPTLVEKNRIRRFFDNMLGSGSQGYGIRIATSAAQGSLNVIRNNLISDIYSNGGFYGIYDGGGYQYNTIHHNTISLDDLNSTTFSNTYGIICYSPEEIKNNVVTVSRGGFGQKNCLYYGSSAIVSDNNILFYNAPGGSGGLANYNGTDYGNLNSWQANGNGWDAYSKNADPVYSNPASGNYMPTVLALNNVGFPMSVATDITNIARNLPAPDAGAFEFFNTGCSGTPTGNSVVAPGGIICPSALSLLTMANTYSVNGISFQWQYSTNSALGPYQAISGATLASFVTPTLGTTTWYNAVLSCINGGITYTTSAGQIQIATTLTNSVPYYEDFENQSSVTNLLPNCSWNRSNLPNCKTGSVSVNNSRSPNNGNGFAYFDYGGSYTNNTYRFHTNGIQLNAGVTYSAWVNYITPGWSAYSDISLKVGPNQSNTGLVTLVSVSFPQNQGYSVISNTFQVLSSGIYYLAVTATDNGGGEYMSFDDLGIIAPCTFTNNAANISMSGPSAICSGSTAIFTAFGVGSYSYSWSNGATTGANPVSPINNTVYTVIGTNLKSNCTKTLSASLVVNPLPSIQIFSPKTSICMGESVALSAFGSVTSYSWNNGPNAALFNVTPQSNTTYNIIGSDANGCSTSSSILINVNQLPQINVVGNTDICLGEAVNLTGTGANTYSWSAETSYFEALVITSSPKVNTTFTVTGTDPNGCVGSTVVNLKVNACTGIATVNGNIENLYVYPNPNNGEFTVGLDNGLLKTIEVIDVTGRSIVLSTSKADHVNININSLANGVYYVKIKSDSAIDVLKVVKQ